MLYTTDNGDMWDHKFVEFGIDTIGPSVINIGTDDDGHNRFIVLLRLDERGLGIMKTNDFETFVGDSTVL